MGLFSKADDEQTTGPAITVERCLMLDEEDFRCLVRGGVLHCDNIKIALQDIGFDKMHRSIEDADKGIDTYKNHIRKG